MLMEIKGFVSYCWSGRSEWRKSYLVSEQIPDHLYVACGCRQVKRCHLVHVSVWESKHSCLPQIVHCNTGKDNQVKIYLWLCSHTIAWHRHFIYCDVLFPSLTCCPQSLHDALLFSPAGLWGANQLHTASFGAWDRCSPAWEESEVQTLITKVQSYNKKGQCRHNGIVTFRI